MSSAILQPDANNVTPEVTEENAEQSASDKVEDIDGGEEEEGKEVKKEEELVSPEDTPTKVAEGTGKEREDATKVAEGTGEEREDATMAAEGTGEEREVDQEHSPSQKKSRGRRKKFKPASERTDVQATS